MEIKEIVAILEPLHKIGKGAGGNGNYQRLLAERIQETLTPIDKLSIGEVLSMIEQVTLQSSQQPIVHHETHWNAPYPNSRPRRFLFAALIMLVIFLLFFGNQLAHAEKIKHYDFSGYENRVTGSQKLQPVPSNTEKHRVIKTAAMLSRQLHLANNQLKGHGLRAPDNVTGNNFMNWNPRKH